jgi:hypothetical protein
MKYAFFLIALLPGMLFPQETETIATEIHLLALSQPLKGYYFFNGEEVKELQASTKGFRPSIRYQGPARIRLYTDPAHVLDPEQAHPPVQVLDLGTPGTRTMVLVFHGAENQVVFRPIPFSEEQVPPGSYFFLNLTQQPAMLDISGKQFRLDARGASLLREGNDFEPEEVLHAKVAANVDGKPSLVYSSSWWHSSKRKFVVVLFPGKHVYQPMEVRKVYMPVPKKAPVEPGP